MSIATGAAGPAPATTPTGIPGAAPRRRPTRRGALVGLAVIVLLAVLVALILASGRPTGYLDPESTGRYGTEALVEVLRHHGVEVDVVRGVRNLEAAGVRTGTTVLVGDPRYIGAGAAELAATVTRRADRVVLLNPSQAEVDAFDIPVTVSPASAPEVRGRCDSPVARSSDTVIATEVRFATPQAPADRHVTLCFPLPDPAGDPRADPGPGAPHGAAMVTAQRIAGHPETVAIGFGIALANGLVTEDSHAGIAVRALGGSPRLLWYQPDPGDLAVTASGGTMSTNPWPRWLRPAVSLLMTAVVMLALVRGRRLGRLVAEPLPVVVRAIETTESRGRLYRRAKDRERAAAILRDATVRRLRGRLAIAPTTPAEVVVPLVAAATGLPAPDIGQALFGPPPTDDPGLLRLGQLLADLEERARHP
jgi:hypothetical protein